MVRGCTGPRLRAERVASHSRAGALRAHDVSSGSELVRATFGGNSATNDAVSVFIPRGDRVSASFIHREIFLDECYLQNGITIEAGDVVVDVGANVGLFALFCAERIGNAGRVVSFEPGDHAFRALELNAKGGDGTIIPRKIALGNSTGEAEIKEYNRASGWTTLQPSSESIVTDVSALAGNEFTGNRDFPGSWLVNRLIPRPLKRSIGALVARALMIDSSVSTCEVDTLSNQLERVEAEAGERWAQIALVKIDVERMELEVVQGVSPEDWLRINQVVAEVHDGPPSDKGDGCGGGGGRIGRELVGEGGILAEFVGILEGHGFEVAVEQSEELDGSALYNVFAKKRSLSL